MPDTPLFTRRSGKGPPILWIHGLGESSRCFLNIIKGLDGFCHWLPDLPGYGRSQGAEVYSLTEAAQQMANLLMVDGPAAIVGHSMGGVVGTLLCEHHPPLVRKFINVEGNISLGDCGYSAPICAQGKEEFVSRGYFRLLEELYTRGRDDVAHCRYLASMSVAQPEIVYAHSHELVELSKREELAHRMARLSVPHLYIAGSPGGAASRSLALLEASGVELSKLEPSGHWPFIDQPEQFVKAIKAALS